jgi:FeS assembly SUF system protein
MDIYEKMGHLEDRIVEELKLVFDPEIPVNVYDLGLIYNIEISDRFDVVITMTLTSPNCPEAESLPVKVENSIKAIRDVSSVEINLTFEPPWEKEMMSETAMLELGFL